MPVGHEAAVRPRADSTEPRLESVEHMVQLAGAARLGEELGAEPDEAPGGDYELEPHPSGAVVHHLHHAALAQRDELGDDAEVVLGHVDGDALDWLVQLAVDLAVSTWGLPTVSSKPSRRAATRPGSPVAARPALDFPGVRSLRIQHPQRHVADQFGVEGTSIRRVSFGSFLADSGDVLTPIVDRLGSSTVVTGSGRSSDRPAFRRS